MPLLVAYIGHLEKNAPRHLALYAQAVTRGPRNLQMRINRRHPQERRSPGGAAGRVGYVAILECRGLDKWREVELRENDVALGFVVEETNATADGRAVVAERRIRETEAWSEQV